MAKSENEEHDEDEESEELGEVEESGEHGEDEQSGDNEEKDDTLESDDTEEEDESSQSALEALVKKRKKDLVEGERALKKAMLQKREKVLAGGERALQKATLRFEKEKTTVCGDAAPSDVLHLNIGGTKMTVLRRTLTSVPGSMLASKFSGRFDESMERDREGTFSLISVSQSSNSWSITCGTRRLSLPMHLLSHHPILPRMRSRPNTTRAWRISLPTHCSQILQP
jgi:hypothetical protein